MVRAQACSWGQSQTSSGHRKANGRPPHYQVPSHKHRSNQKLGNASMFSLLKKGRSYGSVCESALFVPFYALAGFLLHSAGPIQLLRAAKMYNSSVVIRAIRAVLSNIRLVNFFFCILCCTCMIDLSFARAEGAPQLLPITSLRLLHDAPATLRHRCPTPQRLYCALCLCQRPHIGRSTALELYDSITP